MSPLASRRALALALAAAAAVFSSGCERRAEGTVRVIVIGNAPRIVDPAQGPLGTGEALLSSNAAQGLVRLDARGQIEPGLAERWNVSDDGLSYIFRLAANKWPNGRKLTAEQVARLLRRSIAESSKNELKDTFGAVEEIVAMTDRVLEIRLSAPRPELLQLLSHPALGLVSRATGAGPFAVERTDGELRLIREVAVSEDEEPRQERLQLTTAPVTDAVQEFTSGKADLVLGGTFVDLPVAQSAKLPRNTLRFDPASGLFGLVPTREGGVLDESEVRRLLSRAIDREALIAALAVPGLAPRVTVLEGGLANVADPAPVPWAQVPAAERLPELQAAAGRLFGAEPPLVRIHLPDGPGSQILFDRLRMDWGALGVKVERATSASRADLRLVDQVAPSASAAWFLRRFRCGEAAICDDEVDELLDNARTTQIQAQRSAFLLEASRRIDALQLYIPLAAPIRWSLVSSRITSFAGNRFARHTLIGLEEQLSRGE